MKKTITIFFVLITLQISAQCWTNISAGANHSLAIKNDGMLWALGSNSSGKLGNGTPTTNVVLFTQVGTFTDSEQIATGYYHVLNINQDGFIRATGKNDKGQLGDGTTTQKNSLTSISCYPSVLSNEDFETGELKVYPNPVNNVLNILWDNEIAKVSIYNLLGQEISAQSVENNQASIDITNLSAGTYLVTVVSGSQVKTIKVVKN